MQIEWEKKMVDSSNFEKDFFLNVKVSGLKSAILKNGSLYEVYRTVFSKLFGPLDDIINSWKSQETFDYFIFKLKSDYCL